MNLLWLGFAGGGTVPTKDWLALWPEAWSCDAVPHRSARFAGRMCRTPSLSCVDIQGGPYALPSLLAFAAPGHILFGSDYPWAPTEVIESFNDPRLRCRSPGLAHR